MQSFLTYIIYFSRLKMTQIWYIIPLYFPISSHLEFLNIKYYNILACHCLNHPKRVQTVMWKLLKIIRGLDIIVSWVMEFLTCGYKFGLILSNKWMFLKEISVFCKLTFLGPTKIGHNSNAGQKSAEGRFLSKLVYNFRPAKILCTYQDIHIWGGQQQKNGAKSSKP